MSASLRRFGFLLPWFLVGLLLILPLTVTKQQLPIRDFDVGERTRLLTTLIFMSLVLERALEVFVTTWRGEDRAQIELHVRHYETELARNPEVRDAAAESKLLQAQEKLTAYRAHTQQIALWAALVLGVFISAVGVRVLLTMVDPFAFTVLAPAQQSLFVLLDVLLTGGVLAGGSAGIHKLFSVYDSFTSATARRAQAISSAAVATVDESV